MRTQDPSKAERLVAIRGRKRAEDYVNTVHEHPCQYGHFGCASTEGGACCDEVAALIRDHEETIA